MVRPQRLLPLLLAAALPFYAQEIRPFVAFGPTWGSDHTWAEPNAWSQVFSFYIPQVAELGVEVRLAPLHSLRANWHHMDVGDDSFVTNRFQVAWVAGRGAWEQGPFAVVGATRGSVSGELREVPPGIDWRPQRHQRGRMGWILGAGWRFRPGLALEFTHHGISMEAGGHEGIGVSSTSYTGLTISFGLPLKLR